MFRLESEKELIQSFRTRDQSKVTLPKTMRFPLVVDHYLTWTEPGGVRIYLVLKKPQWKSALGVVFRRDQSSSLSPTGICDWCHDYGPADQIGLLTATLNAKKRVGVNLCLDLSCVEKMKNKPFIPPKKLEELILKHEDRMIHFCAKGLQMIY